MKKRITLLFCTLFIFLLTACSNHEKNTEEAIQKLETDQLKIGILFDDVGLGDQSFNDLAMKGLIKARNDLNVEIDYRDLTMVSSLEDGVQELIDATPNIVIGVGYTTQEPIEAFATQYPDIQFVLVDTVSDLENVDGLTFEEEEGSYLAGVVAAKTSQSNVLGFVGGMVDPIIEKFLKGFTEGAQSINPDIEILVEYADTYSDDQVGAKLAKQMIEQKADVLYAVAGYTGVGLLREAQKGNVYAIGVDVDQYFYAEQAVITSMLKNIDIAVYQYVEKYLQEQPTEKLDLVFGIAEDGVGLSPIRIVSNATQLEETVEQTKNTLRTH